MAPPEFKPGMFEPVITIGQRPDGNTRAFHGDKTGLYDCAHDTFSTAFSTAVSRGANMDMSRRTAVDLSKIVAQFLWVRNLANQLNKVGVNQGFAREVLRDLEIPEPLVKLFNAYGHYEHDASTYVQLDLEREFSFGVLDLAYMVRDLNLDDEDYQVRDPPVHHELHGLNLSPQGDIVIDNRLSVTEYISKLITHLLAQQADTEYKLRTVKNISDLATERDLTIAQRWLRMQPATGQLPPRPVDYTLAVTQYITDAIGNQGQGQGAVLDKRAILRSIHRASDVIRTLSDELLIVMSSVHLPKYEQGSVAQATETIEDITYTPFPISMADATVSAGFKVGRVLRRFLRGAPEDIGPGLRSELINKSVRRRA